MIRYARMTGRKALWLPGTDHAGIATQVGQSAWVHTHLPLRRQAQPTHMAQHKSLQQLIVSHSLHS
jgi:valyl-tRNA synthetase